MFIHTTSITHRQVASNNRGDGGGGNVSPLQTLLNPESNELHSVVTAPALRYALRQAFAEEGQVCNRKPVRTDTGQPAVEYSEAPDQTRPERFMDDLYMGFMVTGKNAKPAGKTKKKGKEAEVAAEKGRKQERWDSPLYCAPALSLDPYEADTLFHQAPKVSGAVKDEDTKGGALYQVQAQLTAYRWFWALDLERVHAAEGGSYTEMFQAFMRVMADPPRAGGNHARYLYYAAPASAVLRLTTRRSLQLDPLAWRAPDDFGGLKNLGRFEDLPGEEFYVGGDVVQALSDEEMSRLGRAGVHLFGSAQAAYAAVAEAVCRQ